MVDKVRRPARGTRTDQTPDLVESTPARDVEAGRLPPAARYLTTRR